MSIAILSRRPSEDKSWQTGPDLPGTHRTIKTSIPAHKKFPANPSFFLNWHLNSSWVFFTFFSTTEGKFISWDVPQVYFICKFQPLVANMRILTFEVAGNLIWNFFKRVGVPTCLQDFSPLSPSHKLYSKGTGKEAGVGIYGDNILKDPQLPASF